MEFIDATGQRHVGNVCIDARRYGQENFCLFCQIEERGSSLSLMLIPPEFHQHVSVKGCSWS